MKTRSGVIVRQRHIDRGRCRSPKSCPIAVAMKEQLGTDKVRSPDLDEVRMSRF